MKKFTDFYEDSEINEKIVGQKKLLGDPRKVNLITEPTDKEIDYLLQSNPLGIRGGISPDGKIYVWRLDVDPRVIQREFGISLMAEILWDPKHRQEITIRLLKSNIKIEEIDPSLLEKIEEELIYAFPFLKKYHLTGYTYNSLVTKDLK